MADIDDRILARELKKGSAELIVLSIVEARPRHGYEISKLIELRSGGLTIANAPGAGIADDKAIYSYMPDIVEFYTGETAILKNVPTWRCAEPDALRYVLEHLEELVVKEVHGSGGYGMLVGPAASKRERAAFARKLKARPEAYIAQPTLALSTVPILTKKGLAPRHADLRPFVLVSPERIEIVHGDQIYFPKSELPTSVRNALVRLAAFKKTDFYNAQAMRLPTYDKPRIIACPEDHAQNLAQPRGIN